VVAHDRYVGASLRLVRALGLRRKESVLFRPYQSVVAFADTGMAPEEQLADRYVRVQGKGGRIRFVPIDSPARQAAVTFAQEIAGSQDAHMGDPAKDLKRNLRRFDNVLRKFGIAAAQLGVTAHGLRHEALIDHYESLTGRAPPVRGGDAPPPEVDHAARQAVARMAGHSRVRSSGAYLGAVRWRPEGSSPPTTLRPDDPKAAVDGASRGAQRNHFSTGSSASSGLGQLCGRVAACKATAAADADVVRVVCPIDSPQPDLLGAQALRQPAGP
jgi:hypothetical protein